MNKTAVAVMGEYPQNFISAFSAVERDGILIVVNEIFTEELDICSRRGLLLC